MSSEVSQLRQEIELVCQSINLALNGYSIAAQHRIIAHKHKILDRYCEKLTRTVGEQKAAEITCELYMQHVK
ncbi:hypothetical protein EPA93_26285 [Ktedonosporobacter rubrisoli]|uniref:Uncharacterized protein n=1 Tax=Ktedonosporobacter rubrisoli TaxID=2509675 RepID=A0A4P6JV71_KTERU|nr:hypothetical protein [Ktedonosporobacter rubrisoli]QBD79305.1 hypothetical protein EPA93_26285 [Ktedonosporobacter rubrisoli]